MEKIKNIFKKYQLPVIYRKSLGTEIGAGCGQLGEYNIEL